MHFLRNCFTHLPKGTGEMVAATIRTIFAQPATELVRTQLDTVADMLGEQFPKVKEMFLDAKEDLTASAILPLQHWKKIQSTNPLERLTREIKRRTDVVQVFPNPAALKRLVTRRAVRTPRRVDRLPPPLPPRRGHDRATPALPDSAPTLPRTTNKPAG